MQNWPVKMCAALRSHCRPHFGSWATWGSNLLDFRRQASTLPPVRGVPYRHKPTADVIWTRYEHETYLNIRVYAVSRHTGRP